jgi:hypothetical protein
VCGHFLPGHYGWQNKFIVNHPPILVLLKITPGFGQNLEEAGLYVLRAEFACVFRRISDSNPILTGQ